MMMCGFEPMMVERNEASCAIALEVSSAQIVVQRRATLTRTFLAIREPFPFFFQELAELTSRRISPPRYVTPAGRTGKAEKNSRYSDFSFKGAH
jgi:hypothetical protein